MCSSDPDKIESAAIRSRPSYQPMLLVVVAFAAGIFIDREWDIDWRFSFFSAWLCLVGWLLARRCTINTREDWLHRRSDSAFKRERIASTILLVGFVLAGSFWHHGRWNWYSQNEIGQFATGLSRPCCLEATVISEPLWMVSETGFDSHHETEMKTRLVLKVNRLRDGLDWTSVGGICDLVIHQSVSGIHSGDQIEVFGYLIKSSPSSNPGGFDFQEYYRGKSKRAFLHAYQAESVSVVETANWLTARWISSLRRRLNELTWQYIPSPETGFASAILLGNREQLSRGRRQQFLETGTAHLLAISGLHVGILAGSFFCFFRVGVLSRRKSLWLTIMFVLFYAWLVEFRPPALRASILVTLYCLGRLLGEGNFSFNLLAIAGFIVLVLNPSDLFGIGPQLSFLAVASLTVSAEWIFGKPEVDPIQRLISGTRSPCVRIRNWAVRQCRMAVLVSFVIWLIALPLVAYHFHLIAPVALVANPLLLIPIAVSLYGGLAVLVLGAFLPSLATVFGELCRFSLGLIEWGVAVFQSVPLGHFWTAGPPGWSVVLFYTGVFFLVIYPETKIRSKWLPFCLMAWLIFAWMIPARWSSKGSVQRGEEFVCTFLDVGHGSSVLLQLPDGKNVLYDSGSLGSPDYGARSIAGALWYEGIEHVDAVVISHADVDHFNALPQLVRQFSIDQVFVSFVMLKDQSSQVQELLAVLEKRGVEVVAVSIGDQPFSSSKIRFDILNPPREGIRGNDNANSIVWMMEYGGKRILLPGDLEEEGLNRLLVRKPIECEILMAAHHGSSNSLPAEFVNWASPQYVVISCGRNRVSESMKRDFSKARKAVLRTDRDGAIQFRMREDGATVVSRWKIEPW
ncbi:DNA internalization-related competence protein ComEC/Rec2 [Mariniblastus sp.]|nr:DNA internalization-related competence protein ComEC/Rec2 [Mariniblastus sp.]